MKKFELTYNVRKRVRSALIDFITFRQKSFEPMCHLDIFDSFHICSIIMKDVKRINEKI
jgi:hypothetical protein